MAAERSGPVQFSSVVAQPCPTLCDPMNYNLPGSCVLGFSRQEYWSGLPFTSQGTKYLWRFPNTVWSSNSPLYYETQQWSKDIS